MSKILKLFIFLFIIFIALNCSEDYFKIILSKDNNYPKWLKDEKSHTDQTSGIAFIGRTNKSRNFLLADDTGSLHRLSISSNDLFKLTKIRITGQAEKYLANYPKKDFEEISYDSNTGEVYLSIEGNGNEFKKYVGIFKVKFAGKDINSNEIDSLEKINFSPEDLFLKYTHKNIGYEGFTSDSKYYYLGLEVFAEVPVFS